MQTCACERSVSTLPSECICLNISFDKWNPANLYSSTFLWLCVARIMRHTVQFVHRELFIKVSNLSLWEKSLGIQLVPCCILFPLPLPFPPHHLLSQKLLAPAFSWPHYLHDPGWPLEDEAHMPYKYSIKLSLTGHATVSGQSAVPASSAQWGSARELYHRKKTIGKRNRWRKDDRWKSS